MKIKKLEMAGLVVGTMLLVSVGSVWAAEAYRPGTVPVDTAETAAASECNGVVNGEAECTYQFGGTYKGTLKNGLRDGHGVLTLTVDGSRYEGNFSNGLKDGQGALTWANGDTYEGEFSADKLTGQGLYVWANGNGYKGGFVNSKMNGKGVFLWRDGGRYEGSFVEDKKHGYGLMNFPNGDIYEGEFTDDKRTGMGRYDWENGTRTVGYFVDGVRISDERPQVVTSVVETVPKIKEPDRPGLRFNADGTATRFIAINNKIEEQATLVKEKNAGCYISDMIVKNSGNLLCMREDNPDDKLPQNSVYSWSGQCVDGLASGEGVLRVDTTIMKAYILNPKRVKAYYQYSGVKAEAGTIEGEVYCDLKTEYSLPLNYKRYYYFGDDFFSRDEYEADKASTQAKIAFANSYSNSLSSALAEAKSLEGSNDGRAKEIYQLIIDLYPERKESLKAKYRKAYLEVDSSSDLQEFISDYAKNDPDKLVAKAKAKLSDALSSEADQRRSYDRQRQAAETARQNRSGDYTDRYNSYDSTWNSHSAIANCVSGGTAQAYYNEDRPNVIYYQSSGFEGNIEAGTLFDDELSEGLRRGCLGR